MKKINSINDVEIGDVIRKQDVADAVIVTSIGDGFLVATKHVHVSNPNEWMNEKNEVFNSIQSMRRSHVIESLVSKEKYHVLANYTDYCIAVKTEIIRSIKDYVSYGKQQLD